MPYNVNKPVNKISKQKSEKPLFLIAGPCVIESREHCFIIAEKIKSLAHKHGFTFIFKASYDKANRTSLLSYRGPGMKVGLEILSEIQKQLCIPVISDVHSVEEVKVAGDYLDIIQIPAFLCRQTDLVLAAGNTGLPVNVKKGQYLAPWEMQNIIKKLESTGNTNIILTERGTSFGYNNLVSDMRSLVIMREYGYPVVFDATHSVQLPGGIGNASGGESKFVQSLARAATAVGIDGLFVEVHDRPEAALCDSSCMASLELLNNLLEQVKSINDLINNFQIKGALKWTL